MKKRLFFLKFMAILLLLGWTNNCLLADPPSGKSWVLKYSDEFNGSSLDANKWTLGFGWALNHASFSEKIRIQNLTFDGSNAVFKGEVSGGTYYSAAIHSKGKMEMRYGYWEARAKISKNVSGCIPAFWQKRNDDDWPPEADIFEFFGTNRKVQMTLHYGDPDENDGASWDGGDMTNQFHTYGFEYTPDYVRWYVDGVVRREVTTSQAGQFFTEWDDNPIYTMLNIHMTDKYSWLGSVDVSSLPVYMHVDYFRMYEETTGPALSVNPTSLNFNSDAGSQNITVNSNVAWTVTDNQSWISVSPVSGSNTGTIAVSVTSNTSTSSRTGTVTVSGEGITRTITISQAGYVPPASMPWNESFTGLTDGTTSDNGTTSWTSSRTTGTFAVNGERFMINGAGTEGVWTSQVIDLFSSSSADISVLVDDSDANKEVDDYVKVYYKLNGGAETLIGQVSDDISATTLSVSGISGSTLQIVVRALVSFTDEFYYLDNISVQPAAVVNILTVSPTSLSFGNASASQNLTLTSNVSWTVTDDQSWITVTPTSGSNNGTVSVSVTENTSTSNRTGSVTISGGGITRIINISQSGATPVLNVSVSSLSFTSAQGSQNVSITSNTSWTASGDQSWITVSPASGSNNGSVAVNVTENTSTSSRTGIVSISGSGITRTINISQAGATPTTGLPWTESFTALANGTTSDNGTTGWTSSRSTGSFSVNAERFMINGAGTEGVWTSQVIDISSASVVDLSVLVDDGDAAKETADYVKVFYKLNGGAETLAGQVTDDISATTLTATGLSGSTIQIVIRALVSASDEYYYFDNISVVAGTIVNQLTVTPTSLSFSSASGSQNISVTSNVAWTVSDNQTWISVTPASGSNNGTVSVSLTENTSTSRTGTVTISGGGITRTISVSQAAGGITTDSYQAENYTAQSGCSIRSDITGFTGTGFVDMGGNGTWFEWNNVSSANAASVTLSIIYANGGTTNRQCAVYVNGTNIGNIALAPTGAWTTWQTTTINANLNAGNNTIRITANTTNGGPNVDRMDVTGGGLKSATAINADKENAVKLFPNPSEGVIHLELENSIDGNLFIFDATGKRVYGRQIHEKNIEFNPGLRSGTYILIIESAEFTKQYMIMIK